MARRRRNKTAQALSNVDEIRQLMREIKQQADTMENQLGFQRTRAEKVEEWLEVAASALGKELSDERN